MAFGPEAGLELVDALVDEPLPRDYHLPGVRGDLLARLGRDTRRVASSIVGSLTRNVQTRNLLRERAVAVCPIEAREPDVS